jgi:hypothetical protein
MGECDECYRTEFCLERDHRRVENRPGGTHPGAEQGAMGGSLMLGMVPGMFDRLSLCQSTDGKNTEHQEDRQVFEDTVVHLKRPSVSYTNGTGGRLGLSRRRLEVGNKMKAEAEIKVEGKIQTLFFLSLDLSLSLVSWRTFLAFC